MRVRGESVQDTSCQDNQGQGGLWSARRSSLTVKFDYQIQTRKKIGSIQCYVLVTGAGWTVLDGGGQSRV